MVEVTDSCGGKGVKGKGKNEQELVWKWNQEKPLVLLCFIFNRNNNVSCLNFLERFSRQEKNL